MCDVATVVVVELFSNLTRLMASITIADLNIYSGNVYSSVSVVSQNTVSRILDCDGILIHDAHMQIMIHNHSIVFVYYAIYITILGHRNMYHNH